MKDCDICGNESTSYVELKTYNGNRKLEDRSVEWDLCKKCSFIIINSLEKRRKEKRRC